MDITEKTKRLNLLKERMKNNPQIIDSAVSSLLCRLSTVTHEAIYDLLPKLQRNNNPKYDSEDDYDENGYPIDFDLEEYKLIELTIVDALKETL